MVGLKESEDQLEVNWFNENLSFDVPTRGDIRVGTIVSINRGEVLIDIGAKSEGMIDSRELDRMSRSEREKLVIGDEVDVYVQNPEDKDGNIILSLAKAEEEMDWRWAEELLDSQDVFEGSVSGYNKGGLLVQMRRVRGFIPASQLDNVRRQINYGATPDERWAHMVGEPVQVKVIEVDRSRNRLILSERAAMKDWRESRKDHLLSELQEGEIREGRVINLADFGAFVDLGGADGLIHLSELSWKRVAHPREVLNVGDKVKVYVLNVDRDRRRIGLSLKRLESDPWLEIEETCQVGSLVEGKITKITKFGAFAQLSGLDGIEGLIHISELSDEHVSHPREVISEGNVVTVRVIRVDSQRRRLGLSIRRVDSDEYLDADWFENEDWDAEDDDEEFEPSANTSEDSGINEE
jgi:small subunit ribosomal protein S1